jgi:hypothetical protein
MGTHRHIINMRKGNTWVQRTHFKMESLDTVRQLVRPKDWAVKVDIKSAFTHVAIARQHRDFFRIRWRGQHLRFRAMPFGYSDAPRVFTHLIRAALRPLRAQGIRLIAYLDDILLLAPSKQLAVSQGQRLVRQLHQLGFDLKAEKCVLEPTQRIEFLGFNLDSVSLSVHLPTGKVKKLRQEVASTLRKAEAGPVSAKHLASTLGKLRSAHPAFGPANLLSRALQWDLRAALLRGRWKGHTVLSAQARSDLRWWHDHLTHWGGRLLFPPPPTRVLTTDASESGWGGWVSTATDLETPLATTFGFWSRAERRLPSNQREMRASLLALECFSSRLHGQSVVLRSDNMTNVANICRGGGRSERTTQIATHVWELCVRESIHLTAIYHPGAVNTLADQLSRTQWERDDWMLAPSLFQGADRLWGPLTTDLFASSGNHQVPRYYSRYPDAFAAGLDALRQNWHGLQAYANPPFALLGRVARKIETDTATVVVVLPEWRSAPWWPLLFPLLVDTPRRLPRAQSTFRPASMGNLVGVGVPPWETLCVRLSGDASQQQAFRTQLYSSLPDAAARAQMTRSMQSGDVSLAIALALERTPWPVLQPQQRIS